MTSRHSTHGNPNRRRKKALENLERRILGQPILGKIAKLDAESLERCEAEASVLRSMIK